MEYDKLGRHRTYRSCRKGASPHRL
ncbi:unnamed protein product [Ectocarpus sp. CCAP 1310/34]|nr:unnamed protein product [Ectocarpus sp. CCAP 1310/34]